MFLRNEDNYSGLHLHTVVIRLRALPEHSSVVRQGPAATLRSSSNIGQQA
jgi:hypothetical protein